MTVSYTHLDVYKRQLLEDMKKPGTAEFLKWCGYEDTDPEKALIRLSRRLSESDQFPHEIGLFLGYPLGDVIGFKMCIRDRCYT